MISVYLCRLSYIITNKWCECVLGICEHSSVWIVFEALFIYSNILDHLICFSSCEVDVEIFATILCLSDYCRLGC